MCVPCSANKCRIRESDLQAACLYIIFLNWYNSFQKIRRFAADKNRAANLKKIGRSVGLVGREGFEPSTNGLKVRCSTS